MQPDQTNAFNYLGIAIRYLGSTPTSCTNSKFLDVAREHSRDLQPKPLATSMIYTATTSASCYTHHYLTWESQPRFTKEGDDAAWYDVRSASCGPKCDNGPMNIIRNGYTPLMGRVSSSRRIVIRLRSLRRKRSATITVLWRRGNPASQGDPDTEVDGTTERIWFMLRGSYGHIF